MPSKLTVRAVLRAGADHVGQVFRVAPGPGGYGYDCRRVAGGWWAAVPIGHRQHAMRRRAESLVRWGLVSLGVGHPDAADAAGFAAMYHTTARDIAREALRYLRED